MSKKQKHASARRLGNLLVIAGAIIWSAGGSMHTEAQLSGQGTAVGTYAPTELQWASAETVLPAASEPQGASGILAFGMLMMLIGFGLHAWQILNRGEGRTVPVRIRKQRVPQKTAQKNRKTRRQAEVIWVERTIRF